MPPRNDRQLDQISQAIGRLEGSFASLDNYIHEREHNIANLSQKVDGLSQQITREVSRMKAEIEVQLRAMDQRIAKLEESAAKEAGERGLLIGFVNSPIVGWLVAAAAVVWAALTGRQG